MVFGVRAGKREGEPPHCHFRRTSSQSDGLRLHGGGGGGAKERRGKSVTLFTAVGIRAQMAMVIISPSKLINRYALIGCKRIIHKTGRTRAGLRVDDESYTNTQARACASGKRPLALRVAPMASPQSTGVTERSHHALDIMAMRIPAAYRLGRGVWTRFRWASLGSSSTPYGS